MDTQTGRMDNVFDYGILTLFVGVLISLLITSYVLQTNPALFFIVVLVVGIMGAVAGYFSNAYNTFINDSTFTTISSNFPVTNFLMNNYLIIVIITVFLMLIVFFAKPNEGGY
jgi:hypothetical protein